MRPGVVHGRVVVFIVVGVALVVLLGACGSSAHTTDAHNCPGPVDHDSPRRRRRPTATTSTTVRACAPTSSTNWRLRSRSRSSRPCRPSPPAIFRRPTGPVARSVPRNCGCCTSRIGASTGAPTRARSSSPRRWRRRSSACSGRCMRSTSRSVRMQPRTRSAAAIRGRWRPTTRRAFNCRYAVGARSAALVRPRVRDRDRREHRREPVRRRRSRATGERRDELESSNKT